MRKYVFIAIITGMVGFSIYQFVSDSGEPGPEEQADEMSNNMIVSPSKDEGEASLKDGTGLERGQTAPDFELTTLDGEKVNLSDFRGDKVMLNFWATWCPPCRAEMPDMQKLHENTDVKILAVNLTGSETNTEKVEDFLDELDVTFTVPLDEDMKVSDQYEVVAYPTTYMIDPDGRIQFQSFGALNYDMMKQEFEKMD